LADELQVKLPLQQYLLRKFRSGKDRGFEHDLVTKLLQTPDIVAAEACGFETVKETGAEVGVGRALLEHVVENTNIEWPMAIRARFLPRRPTKRLYCEAEWVFFV
jgi:hypothetical protein